MLGRAHHPDRGGRVGQRVVRALRKWQRTVCDRAGTPCRSRSRTRCGWLTDISPRSTSWKVEVAAEREEPQPGVAVDVAFADLDEPSAERQQFEPGALCGAGQGVEHDVDAVPVGIAADLLGELDAARVVDMLNSHVAQQFSTLLAAGRGEDLGARGAGDRYRGLPHAAGRGVDQHPVTGSDPGQVMQAVPGGGMRGGHRGRLVIGQAGRQRDGQAGVAGDERAPAAVGGKAADMVTDLVIGDVRTRPRSPLRRNPYPAAANAPRSWGSGRTRAAHRRS